MFKVGDYIKGKCAANEEYSFTNIYMTLGLVEKVNSDEMLVKILEHDNEKSEIGNSYWVKKSNEYFELINKRKKINYNLPARYTGNENATILFWDDDTKTVVKKNKEDAYDIAKGFLWAYFLKTSGMSRTQANKYIEKVVNDIIATNKKEKDKKKKKKVK